MFNLQTNKLHSKLRNGQPYIIPVWYLSIVALSGQHPRQSFIQHHQPMTLRLPIQQSTHTAKGTYRSTGKPLICLSEENKSTFTTESVMHRQCHARLHLPSQPKTAMPLSLAHRQTPRPCYV